MKRNDFWITAKQNWRALVYLLVLTVLAVVLVVVCVRRGQEAAQPTPTPRTSAEVRKDAVQTLLDGMTTHEKICQLLIVQPEVLTGGSTVTGMTDELAAALRAYPVGGVLLSAQNMTSGEQLAALTAALSNGCKTAPLISVDEEGGRVARLMNTVGTTKLGSMYSYRAQGTQGAHDNAQTIARDIAAYGFNTDFAPVADVWTNKRSNAIGDRAYSDDYDEAAALVAAAVKGFHDGGVICCLKHFPGHGSTKTDSHDGAATVDKTLPQLRQEDLKPFVSGRRSGHGHGRASDRADDGRCARFPVAQDRHESAALRPRLSRRDRHGRAADAGARAVHRRRKGRACARRRKRHAARDQRRARRGRGHRKSARRRDALARGTR